MRKLLAALFALVFLTAFVGCSSDDDSAATDEATETLEEAGDGENQPDDGDADDPVTTASTEPSETTQNDTGTGGGEVVTAPSDIRDSVRDLADAEAEDVSDEEADCAADMLVLVLGEDGARDALAGGSDAVEEALDEASVAFDDAQQLALLDQLSEECQVLLMGGSPDVDGSRAPSGAGAQE